MTISTIKGLKSALAGRSKERTETVLTDASEFAFQQLVDHRNATPLSIIYDRLSAVAGRPKGCSRKNFKEVLDGMGLEFDTKTKAFSVPSGLNIERPDDAWWTDFQTETVKKSDDELFEKAVERYYAKGHGQTEIEKIVVSVIEALRTAEAA